MTILSLSSFQQNFNEARMYDREVIFRQSLIKSTSSAQTKKLGEALMRCFHLTIPESAKKNHEKYIDFLTKVVAYYRTLLDSDSVSAKTAKKIINERAQHRESDQISFVKEVLKKTKSMEGTRLNGEEAMTPAELASHLNNFLIACDVSEIMKYNGVSYVKTAIDGLQKSYEELSKLNKKDKKQISDLKEKIKNQQDSLVILVDFCNDIKKIIKTEIDNSKDKKKIIKKINKQKNELDYLLGNKITLLEQVDKGTSKQQKKVKAVLSIINFRIEENEKAISNLKAELQKLEVQPPSTEDLRRNLKSKPIPTSSRAVYENLGDSISSLYGIVPVVIVDAPKFIMASARDQVFKKNGVEGLAVFETDSIVMEQYLASAASEYARNLSRAMTDHNDILWALGKPAGSDYIHELVHMASGPGGMNPIFDKNSNLDEGFTQYFTERLIKERSDIEQLKIPITPAYPSATFLLKKMGERYGDEVLYQAKFLNNLNPLIEKLAEQLKEKCRPFEKDKPKEYFVEKVRLLFEETNMETLTKKMEQAGLVAK